MQGRGSSAGTISAGQWIGTALLLVGVLTGQVGIVGLLLATWLENVSAGVATVRALVRGDRRRRAAPPAPAHRTPLPGTSSATDDVLARWRRTGRLEVAQLSDLPAGCSVPFFLLHYGMFTLTHGTFLLVGGAALAFSRLAEGDAAGPSLAGGMVGALVLLGATIARAVRDVAPAHAVKEAYAGVITLHLAIVFGGGVGVSLATSQLGPGGGFTLPFGLDAQTAAALALVALFTVSDLVRARVVAHDRRR